MIKKNEGTEYIQSFPDLQKWMRACICCRATGDSSDIPDTLTRNLGNGEFITASAKNIRQYYKPFTVNEISICQICQKLLDNN